MTSIAERLRELTSEHAQGLLCDTAYLDQVCRLTAQELQCDRVILWRRERREPQDLLQCIASHRGAQGDNTPTDPLPAPPSRAYLEPSAAHGVIDSADAWTDERLQALLDSYLVPHNVRALLDVPFAINGETFGVLCCEQIGRPRPWQPHEIALVRRIGSTVSLALATRLAPQAWSATSPGVLDLLAPQA